MPDRDIFVMRFTLDAGTLPEGVTLNESTGGLSMDSSVLGSEDTGSYTIKLMTWDQGVRRHTYTWKREGLGGV